MQVHYIRYCCYSYYHQMGCIRKFPHRTNQSHSLRQTHTKQIEILIREPSSTEIEKRVYIKILRYYMNGKTLCNKIVSTIIIINSF